MKDKILTLVIVTLIIVIGIFWFQKMRAEKDAFKNQQIIRKQIISQDSLIKISDGVYRKLVADTLTRKELSRLAEEIVELKNRKPITITRTIIQPVEIRKETDSIFIDKDSVHIKDYYPNKINPFLKYTNDFSLKTKTGISNFNFNPITLDQVVTKKEDGLYQIDFKGPDFLEVKSLDIQTEPMTQSKRDDWGTIIGVEYGKNLESQENIFEVDVYKRYKKFYFGGSVNTDKDLKLGLKLEF